MDYRHGLDAYSDDICYCNLITDRDIFVSVHLNIIFIRQTAALNPLLFIDYGLLFILSHLGVVKSVVSSNVILNLIRNGSK